MNNTELDPTVAAISTGGPHITRADLERLAAAITPQDRRTNPDGTARVPVAREQIVEGLGVWRGHRRPGSMSAEQWAQRPVMAFVTWSREGCGAGIDGVPLTIEEAEGLGAALLLAAQRARAAQGGADA